MLTFNPGWSIIKDTHNVNRTTGSGDEISDNFMSVVLSSMMKRSHSLVVTILPAGSILQQDLDYRQMTFL